MKILLRLMVIVVVCIVGGTSVVYAESTDDRLTEDDAYLLLDELLNLSNTGNDSSAQLQHYKQWAKLHTKTTRGNKLSNGQMKVYLFMVFVATEKAKIESLEEMAKEIVPIFKKQPTVFLGVLRATPFLLPAVCDRINAHFELYGNAHDKHGNLGVRSRIVAFALRAPGAPSPHGFA